jgi:hypothetical protein
VLSVGPPAASVEGGAMAGARVGEVLRIAEFGVSVGGWSWWSDMVVVIRRIFELSRGVL